MVYLFSEFTLGGHICSVIKILDGKYFFVIIRKINWIKPFDIEQLVNKVEAAAQKKREHEEKIKDARTREILSKYEM